VGPHGFSQKLELSLGACEEVAWYKRSFVFPSLPIRQIITSSHLTAIMAHNEDISSNPTHDRFNVAEEKRQARVAELTDNVTGEYVEICSPIRFSD
jgi:hypothetical protein